MALFEHPEVYGIVRTTPAGFTPHSEMCSVFSLGLAHLTYEVRILSDEIGAALRAVTQATAPAARAPFTRRLLALALQVSELRGELNAWTAAYAVACPRCQAEAQASGTRRQWPYLALARLEGAVAAALGLPAMPPTPEGASPGAPPTHARWLDLLAAELDAEATRQPA